MLSNTSKIDFAVPTHASIGDRFDTFAEAVETAKRTIKFTIYAGAAKRPLASVHPQDRPDGKRIFHEGGDAIHYSRAFVHVRYVTENGSDGVLETIEVFLTEEERLTLRGAVA